MLSEFNAVTTGSAILSRAMVPFMPEKVPNLTGKNIFIGAGQYDPIVPREQTLFGFFEKAGAISIVTIGNPNFRFPL